MGIADGYIDPHGVLAPASFARRSPGEGSLPIGQRPVRTRCIGACGCGRYTSSTLQLAPAWHETGLVATLGRSTGDAEGSVWIPLILARDACHLGETARHRHPGRRLRALEARLASVERRRRIAGGSMARATWTGTRTSACSHIYILLPSSQSCIRTRSSTKFSRSPHAPLPSLFPTFIQLLTRAAQPAQ